MSSAPSNAAPASAAQDWKQASVDGFFIAAEAVAWYIMVHVGATGLEHAFLSQLGDRVRVASNATDLATASRASEALALIERAAIVEHGPGLLVVMATAFGGFALMRALLRARFEGILGAIVLLASSVLALNVLLHIAITGDLRVWDAAGFAAYLADADGLASVAGIDAFVRNPDLSRPHGSTIAFVMVFLALMWVRFVVAARSKVTFDRVLRSFSAGFAFTILGLAFAALEGNQRVSMFAVPQFVLGMLALAVANNARAVAPVDGPRRTGPWIAAVGGTVAVLLGVALLLATLAFLNIGALLNAIGEIAWTIIAFILILVITPIYWLIEQIVRLLLPNGLQGLPALPNLQLGPPPELDPSKQPTGFGVPDWAQNGLKFLAVALIVYVIYRLALALMARRRVFTGAVDEVRGQASSGVGLGSILRSLLPNPRKPAGDDWLRLQPIYRLYARAAMAAEDRGYRYLGGETPIEFVTRAERVLEAPPYPPIGLAFDRARYGRHFPEDGQVRSLDAALSAWEAATPPTEELRNRVAGAAPLTDTQEFLLHIVARKRYIQQRRPGPRGAPDPEERQRPIEPMI